MKRLAYTLILDIQLQYRNGFYYAVIFVIAVAGALLHQVPSEKLAPLMGVILFGNLAVNTFYFVAGLLLLEKDEATLSALAVSPLRAREYLASKLITLSGLSLVESSLILLIGYRQQISVWPYAIGLFVGSLLYTLFGLLVVVRYRSINEFLMPSVIFTGLLSIPIFPFLLKYHAWPAYIHPMQAPLLLLQAGFTDLPSWNLAYGLLYGSLWTGILYWFCLKAFRKFVTGGFGAIAE